MAEVANRLLSVPEAANALGVSKHTINYWVSQRKITFIKLGRRTLFDPIDLESLIQTNRHAPKHRPRSN